MTFPETFALYANTNRIPFKYQHMTFGALRGVLMFDCSEKLQAHFSRLSKNKNFHIESKSHHDFYYEGYIYVMDAAEYQKWHEQQEAETAKNEAWWRRFHAADEVTRAKMARGEIA